MFESGSILLHLANKTKRFIAQDLRGRITVNEWLFWQVGGLGPMAGQHGHFNVYAPEAIPYAIARYRRRRIDCSACSIVVWPGAFIAGDDYSADMACYPCINPYAKAPPDLEPFAEVRRWQAAIAMRPATRRAYTKGEAVNPQAGQLLGEEERRVLFGPAKKN